MSLPRTKLPDESSGNRRERAGEQSQQVGTYERPVQKNFASPPTVAHESAGWITPGDN